MADQFVVVVDGLDGLSAWNDLPGKIALNAQRAVNAAAARARTSGAAEIAAQVNFPSNYLSNEGGRFSITQYASKDNLEAVLNARFRPTSLARFATANAPATGTKGSKPLGLTVEVKPGLARFMTGAFLIRLKAGTADIDTKSNLGLAIRLRGRPLENKKFMAKAIDTGLYLLYGPSVSQIFGGDEGVAEKISDPIASYLQTEFERLMDADIQ